MEQSFIEYIQKINDPTEIKGVNIEDTAKNEESELLEAIVGCEKMLSDLQNKKRQVMDQYINGNMEFDDYKNMISAMNEKYILIDNDLQQKKAELPTISTAPKILPNDIVTNLKENWDKLNNSERMIFLHRFIKNITITVEKERTNSSVVKIDNVEFQSGNPQKMVRSKMKNMRKKGKNHDGTKGFNRNQRVNINSVIG